MKIALTVIIAVISMAAVLFILPFIFVPLIPVVRFFLYILGIDMNDKGEIKECIEKEEDREQEKSLREYKKRKEEKKNRKERKH